MTEKEKMADGVIPGSMAEEILDRLSAVYVATNEVLTRCGSFTVQSGSDGNCTWSFTRPEDEEEYSVKSFVYEGCAIASVFLLLDREHPLIQRRGKLHRLLVRMLRARVFEPELMERILFRMHPTDALTTLFEVASQQSGNDSDSES